MIVFPLYYVAYSSTYYASQLYLEKGHLINDNATIHSFFVYYNYINYNELMIKALVLIAEKFSIFWPQ